MTSLFSEFQKISILFSLNWISIVTTSQIKWGLSILLKKKEVGEWVQLCTNWKCFGVHSQFIRSRPTSEFPESIMFPLGCDSLPRPVDQSCADWEIWKTESGKKISICGKRETEEMFSNVSDVSMGETADFF